MEITGLETPIQIDDDRLVADPATIRDRIDGYGGERESFDREVRMSRASAGRSWR